MTLQEKLKCIKKTSTIKPLSEYPETENALDLHEFWLKTIEPNLPDKEIVIQWHKILMEYIQIEDAVFSLRAYGGPSGNSTMLRRGFLNKVFLDGKESFKTFYVDNFFTAFFYSMAKDGYAPSGLDEFKNMIFNRQFPCGCIQTLEEKEYAAYFRGINPEISKKGYKIAHIFSAGENYGEEAGYQSIGTFCKEVFPRGDRNEWSRLDPIERIHFRRIDLKSRNEMEKVRSFAIAHFLRTVHPINYFLVPNKVNTYDKESKIMKTNIYWQDNGIERDEIGEDSGLIEYVAAKIKERYGEIYDEFLDWIYPMGNYVNPQGRNVSINAEYAIGIWKRKLSDGYLERMTSERIKTKSSKKKHKINLIFVPDDQELFKQELLIKKRAEITLRYMDGSTAVLIWDARQFKETSDLMNNIMSKLGHRNDKTQIMEAVFKV